MKTKQKKISQKQSGGWALQLLIIRISTGGNNSTKKMRRSLQICRIEELGNPNLIFKYAFPFKTIGVYFLL